MPKDADLQVRTGDGSIKANGVSGTIDLHSGDGALSVSSLKGTVRLHTGDGSIEASDLDGKCDASSGDGRIRLSGRFDVLSAKSGDGSVGVEALHGSKLDSGWSIASGDGSIDVALPADLPANIEASSGDGRITLRHPDHDGRRHEQIEGSRQNERRRLDAHHPHGGWLHSPEAGVRAIIATQGGGPFGPAAVSL